MVALKDGIEDRMIVFSVDAAMIMMNEGAERGERQARRSGVRRRNSRSRRRWGVVLVLLATAVIGCGPRGPAVEMVEGVVVLDGRPVDAATVYFSPAGGAVGLPAAGRTGPDGTFRLNAVGGARSGAGTRAGDYVVTITKQESDPMSQPGQDSTAAVFEIKLRDLLPKIYGVGTKSPLRATVKKGRNTFRFELRSQPHADLTR